MKKFILVLLLMTQPLLSYAAQSLSRDSIKAFYATSDELDKLEIKYPQEFQRIDTYKLNQKYAMISYIKSSKAYSDIHSVISAKGFSSLSDFFDVSLRLMGGMYKVQMQKMSAQEKIQMENMQKTFSSNIDMMRKNGMPESMIAGMKAQLQEMRTSQIEMQEAAKYATAADVKFINDNYDWIMSVMPKEDLAEHR